MKNTISLKLNRDFRRLYSRGKRQSGAYVAVYISKNRIRTVNRLGLTASTSLGHAVVRNRLKRIMRAAYTDIEPMISTGYDIILVARGRAVGAAMQQVRRDMLYSFGKLNLIEENKQ